MNIKVLHLTTGEEIIGDVKKTENGMLTIKQPHRIIIHHDQSGQPGIAMMPASPFIIDEELTIDTKHIVYMGTADKEIANDYNARFGNGIVDPSQNLKIST